jgi:hypothetical protein
MPYGCSLFADWDMLLGIKSEKLVEIAPESTEMYLLCVVISGQTKGGMFGMFCDIGFALFLYMQFSPVVVPELVPKM